MAKLNQMLAVEKGAKAGLNRVVTDAYHRIQAQGPLNGVQRTYRPRDQEGAQLPPESVRVQYTVDEQAKALQTAMARLIDVTATKEKANTHASADVVLDGVTLASAVPATTLLFLEKQLGDVRTFVSHYPVLDPSEEWHWDDNRNVYVTPERESTRTQKVPRNHVRFPGNDKHPPQVDVFNEDVVVGYWTTVKTSGAVPAAYKAQLLDRVERLIAAVKFAREEANTVEVEQVELGQDLLDYVFAPRT